MSIVFHETPTLRIERHITGYRQDGQHWNAVLSCGHEQGIRHRPPYRSNPWILSEAGRAGRIGARMACRECGA